MYVYDCVIVFFLLMLVIGIGRPLFRNFGRTFVCLRVCALVRAHVCVLQSFFWSSNIIRIMMKTCIQVNDPAKNAEPKFKIYVITTRA